MIINQYEEVRACYDYAAEKGWVIPCLCTENQTTTEAILAAAKAHKEKYGVKRLPVSIAITVNYHGRTQAPNYNAARDWKTGLRLFYDDIAALTERGALYEDIDVLVHLDHVQFDDDRELLDSDLSKYSSIMYDASNLPFDENIKYTAAFSKTNKGKIFIEGACDEIIDAGGAAHNELTTPEKAKRYMDATNVDMIVANLGTEHRASGKELKYFGETARKIKQEIGTRIVLHGASSVSNDQIQNLFSDGICKLNIWTILERDSSPVLFCNMVKNAVKVAGRDEVKKLIEEGYLTDKCLSDGKSMISHFTAMYRNDIVFGKMKEIAGDYFELFCK
jgi:fructose-bisphosphate aldolase class II